MPHYVLFPYHIGLVSNNNAHSGSAGRGSLEVAPWRTERSSDKLLDAAHTTPIAGAGMSNEDEARNRRRELIYLADE